VRKLVPTISPYLSTISQVEAGNAFSIALDIFGSIYSFCIIQNGQLGLNLGSGVTLNVPTIIPNITNITSISAGMGDATFLRFGHVFALRSDGFFYYWGSNYAAQLGISMVLINLYQSSTLECRM
jgi:alpha-tubulin suppressor-like RCC1 family protein